jgi:hypothetical protein
MSIRQTLNRNPAIVTGATVLVTVLAVGFLAYYLATSRSPGEASKQAFFTTDDGATWFADDIEALPPFTKNGKEAVRANIFRCGSDKPFVAYMMRFTPEGKKMIEDARAKAKATNGPPPDALFIEGVVRSRSEVKKPGGQWVFSAQDRPGHEAVTRLGCPSGSMADLEMVMP